MFEPTIIQQKNSANAYYTLAWFSGAISVLLGIAIFREDLPYTFYTFLRWFIFLVAGYSWLQTRSVQDFYHQTKEANTITAAYLFFGFLFNPIFPFSLGRDLWIVADIIALVVTITAIGVFDKEATNVLRVVEEREVMWQGKRKKRKQTA